VLYGSAMLSLFGAVMSTSHTVQDDASQQYEYCYDALQGISPDLKYPMAKTVLFADRSFTKWKWTESIVSILLRILANQAMQDVAIKRGSARRLILYIRLARILKRNLPFAERVFYGLLPALNGVLGLFGQRPRSQNIKHDVKEEPHPKMVEARVESLINEVAQARRPKPPSAYPAQVRSFQDYRDLYQIIYLPNISHHFLEDRSFAAQRVAGVNPLVIAQISQLPENFPVTEGQYQAVMGSDDSLAGALQEGRVYLADYQILETIVPGTLKAEVKKRTEDVQKYSYAPLALFAIASNTCPGRLLTPVAIQCSQAKDSPIFTPPSHTTSDEERWAWTMAKAVVQVADGNHHELISHLGRTHLWIEPIALATYRRLGTEHSLGKLLLPHFEGTFFINNAAAQLLIAPGGGVDQLLSGTLASSVQLSVKAAKGYPFAFNASMLPQTFAARGVDDQQKLPDYPYRDDALLLWHAIHDWVEAYLNIYYKHDEAVQADQLLQDWLKELIADDGGQMTEIGETMPGKQTPGIRTLNYLIDATTLIIFTCSAQHAAVNFPQASVMNFTPNMPLAGFAPEPTSLKVSQSEYFQLLPVLNQAELQMDLLYTLGSVYYTQLGQYKANEVSLEESDQTDYFTDAQVAQPLQDFQQRLQEIELIIQKRNETRPTYYDTLLPSKIPQSTNI
jgi:arachidonate 15-lipoxygenase